MIKHDIRTSAEISALIFVAVLAGGCCSHKGGGGSYEASNAKYYSEAPGTTAKAAPATATTETAQTGNQVVIPLYQESVNVGKQQVDAGTVHVKKTVVTETVNQPVELRKETLTITREPAGSAATTASTAGQGGQAFQEQDFTIQLHREEPVIEKQIVQSGTVVAQRQMQTEQRSVQSQVRREDVAIDKGNAQDVQVSGNVGASSSPGGSTQGAGSAATDTGAITDLKSLTSTTDAQSLSGRAVQLSDMKVQEIVSPTLISVGSDNDSTRVYAHLMQPIDNLKVGDKVNLTGTIKQPSALTSAAGAVGAEASQKLSSQPFFVDAQSAQLSGQ